MALKIHHDIQNWISIQTCAMVLFCVKYNYVLENVGRVPLSLTNNILSMKIISRSMRQQGTSSFIIIDVWNDSRHMPLVATIYSLVQLIRILLEQLIVSRSVRMQTKKFHFLKETWKRLWLQIVWRFSFLGWVLLELLFPLLSLSK